MKIGLISLSGEQLWPALHCISNWHNDITHLFLLHTEDERRSKKPAETIRKFVEKWKPHVCVELSEGQGLPFSGSFLDAFNLISIWIKNNPEIDEWIINVTSGTKIMQLSALQFLGISKVRIIYRELSTNSWFEIFPQNLSSENLIPPRDIFIPNNITDIFPVKDLVEAIWGDAGVFNVEFGELPPPFSLIDVTKASARFCNGWNCKEGFKKTFTPFKESEGQIFEKYMIGILREMGVTNLAISAKRNMEATTTQEADIILNHQGKITILDLKLRGKDEPDLDIKMFNQIRDADRIRNELGGLGAKSILLRPNQRLSEINREIAKSYRIEYLDSDDTHHLIPNLAGMILGTMNKNLEEVQQIITQKNQAEPLTSTFPHSPLSLQTYDSDTKATNVLHFDSLLKKLQNDLGSNWCFFRYDQSLGIDFELPLNWINAHHSSQQSNNRLINVFEAKTKHLGVQVEVKLGKNKRCRVFFHPSDNKIFPIAPFITLFRDSIGGSFILND